MQTKTMHMPDNLISNRGE